MAVKKFFYVFSCEDMKQMLLLGYVCLQKIEQSNIYIFANNEAVPIPLEKSRYILTDTFLI